MIQDALRSHFTECTILTIAHRINTIMDSDMILVIKDGLVNEFAPPVELLQDTSSSFSDMVKQGRAKDVTDFVNDLPEL